MAPRIPTPSKGDLKRIDSALGDITAKMDRVASMSADWGREMADAASKAERLASQLDAQVGVQEEISRQRKYQLDIQSKLNAKMMAGKTLTDKEHDTLVESNAESNRLYANLVKQEKKHAEIVSQIGKQASGWKVLAGLGVKQLASGFDKVGKSIIGLGLDGMEIGLSALEKGINRVYELQEKWTKAMGQLNLTVGATSKGLGEVRARAAKFEGTMHGLTGRFGEGIKMVTDFQMEFNRIIPGKEGDKWTMFGVKVGRALGISATSSAELFKTLVNVGRGFKDATDSVDMIESTAKTAGVSVANFSKSIIESREFMVSFGKQGQKAFVSTAGWITKMGVSLKSLEKFFDITDTIESATKATAKLNTIFGTSINSMDLMLEQDPGKRFEMVRNQLKMQGKSMENLSRQEKKVISETIGLSIEETDAMLKSGESLEQFREREAKAKAKEQSIEKRIQQGMLKTAETMFSFSAAFDKITGAITKLIKPFTDMIGLTKSADKKGKSFGQTMAMLTDKIVGFIEKIAKNKSFSKFMERAAQTAKDLFVKIDAFVSGDALGEWVDKIVKGFGDFFDIVVSTGKSIANVLTSGPVKGALSFVLEHIGGILKAWVAFKAGVAGFKIGGLINQFAKLAGVIDSGIGKGSGVAGALGNNVGGVGAKVGRLGAKVAGAGSKMLGGAGMGMMAGQGIGMASAALGGPNTATGDTGAAIGGALGSLGGPLGTAIGSVAGKLIGESVGSIMDAHAKIKQTEEENAAFDKKLREDVNEKGELTELGKQKKLAKLAIEAREKETVEGKKHQAVIAKLATKHENELYLMRFKTQVQETSEFKEYRNSIDNATKSTEEVYGKFQELAQYGKFGQGLKTQFADVARTEREVASLNAPARVAQTVTAGRGGGNLASRGSSPGSRTEIVAGDVYLDGNKVGKHVARKMILHGAER